MIKLIKDFIGHFKPDLKTKAITPSCRTCRHYGCVKTDDKLNPDKTITRGRIQYEFCTKGQFYLTDYKPCEFHKEGKRSARIMPPPIPEDKVITHAWHVCLNCSHEDKIVGRIGEYSKVRTCPKCNGSFVDKYYVAEFMHQHSGKDND